MSVSPSKYPVCSGTELVKALKKLGYSQVSQRGSHVKLRNSFGDETHTIVVPLHKELDRGTLGSIIKRVRVHIPEEKIVSLLRK